MSFFPEAHDPIANAGLHTKKFLWHNTTAFATAVNVIIEMKIDHLISIRYHKQGCRIECRIMNVIRWIALPHLYPAGDQPFNFDRRPVTRSINTIVTKDRMTPTNRTPEASMM